jgi:acyl-CoA reductase-like NAD-dependent aldehyde dehydrogenase
VIGAFSTSGQSCISVQRVFVHEDIAEEFRARMVERTQELVAGDPRDDGTAVGPMISEAEAERLESWIVEAVAAGAKLLCGGRRSGALLEPTLLESVPKDLPLCAKEAFGPVAVIETFSDFETALDRVNDGDYGLQAGVFTRDLYRMQKAWDRLEVGGVVIGDVPSWRVDHMPYGGVKDSGLGREGVRYAIEDMTEMRLLVIRDVDAARAEG